MCTSISTRGKFLMYVSFLFPFCRIFQVDDPNSTTKDVSYIQFNVRRNKIPYRKMNSVRVKYPEIDVLRENGKVA